MSTLTRGLFALGISLVAACETVDNDPTPDAGATCAVTLCPQKTYCDDITGTAVCHPLPSCETVKCSAGNHCALVDVQCIRAPCPPVAQCVPDVGATACGANSCPQGNFCCNLSCGMCAPMGGACTQIACD